jgi:DNA-binding XRE family transcriptional regulator
MDSRPSERSEISKRFKKLRQRGLLTQRRLGGIINPCRQSACEIENRRVTPHLGTWARFRELQRKYQQPPIVFPKHWS